ncbi:hypothetical protein RHMOL_Rhmol04G0367800 [Rhododendron molle]|uniref:Uncharacterized protein n=1 Tax=Rhododendron molle TaxID=49168 RepID=A0ACC0PAN4_RHOML|nr:hypothetical protein RHMOL_Rhmol04G0367800 [Rhododendron molle]
MFGVLMDLKLELLVDEDDGGSPIDFLQLDDHSFLILNPSNDGPTHALPPPPPPWPQGRVRLPPPPALPPRPPRRRSLST